MNHLEKTCCSLKSAKKLNELGFDAESSFYWELNKANKHFAGRVVFGDPSIDNDWAIPIKAYTAGELGMALPARTISCFRSNNSNEWLCSSVDTTIGDVLAGQQITRSISEADARAKMLIWMIENKHVEV